ncbi:hypothetical protein KL905_001748 [Ogataea polymorpha]|nr:hypothetical protein KL907_001797 [Ogataea polymorpha]KAG7922527.1 hypothetical protein KL905_001748 [Ogataea polymorpha]
MLSYSAINTTASVSTRFDCPGNKNKLKLIVVSFGAKTSFKIGTDLTLAKPGIGQITEPCKPVLQAPWRPTDTIELFSVTMGPSLFPRGAVALRHVKGWIRDANAQSAKSVII